MLGLLELHGTEPRSPRLFLVDHLTRPPVFGKFLFVVNNTDFVIGLIAKVSTREFHSWVSFRSLTGRMS